jgi:dienelactone hydrolase
LAALAVAACSFAQAPVQPKKGPVPPSKGPVAPPKGPVAPPKGPVAPPTTPNASKSPTAVPGAAAAKGPKLPDPEDVELNADGIKIKATYYAGVGAEKKQIVPLILIHDIAGQRGDFHGLAVYLQSLGHTSIAPDLRGRGESKVPKTATGPATTLDPDDYNRPILESMIKDVKACKSYLLDKHIKGELNIGKLCVIGAEFGATLAVRFVADDWIPERINPLYREKNDVKGLVLLSPQVPFKAVGYREYVAGIPPQVAVFIVAGETDTKSDAEAKKIHKQLQPQHSGKADQADLFFEEPATNLSGTKLLGSTLNIKQMIGSFVEKRLAPKAEWEARERR